MKTFYSLLLTLLSLAIQAQTVYFVNSQTGNDSNDGLSATLSGDSGPKASINSAINAASSGDVLSIESGSYAEDVIIDRNLAFVKTGSGSVLANSFTFSFGGQLLEALPSADAINAPLVTINSGSVIEHGITLVQANGTLVVNDGNYNESVFLNKSFDFLANVSVGVNDLILAGQGIKVVLSGRLIVSNSLQFNRPEGGRIELSSGDLVVQEGASVYPGNAASYAITSGSGAVRASITTDGVVFPVGTETTYAPVTISGINSGSEQVGVSVRSAGNTQSFNPWLPDQVNSHVKLQWSIESSVTQTASIRFDYNGSAEPSNWNDVQNRLVAASVNNGDFNPLANSLIGESYASADATPDGLFAIYSDFPNTTKSASLPSFEVYPNPFTNQLQINTGYSSNESFTVRLTDLTGRLVYSNQLKYNNGILLLSDLQDLSSGYYNLTLENQDTRLSFAVVK